MDDIAARMDTGSVMGAIVAATVLPDRYLPVRIRDSYSSQKVAVAKTLSEVKVNWASATVDGALPATDMVIFLFRNALRHYIIYNNNPSHVTGTYNWVIANDASNPFAFPLGLSTLVGSSFGQGFEIEPSHLSNSAGTAYHGPVLFGGIGDGHRYAYLEPSSTTVVTVSLSASDTTVGHLEVFQFKDGRRTLITSIDCSSTAAATASNAAYSPPTIGYYSFVYTHVSSVAAAVATQAIAVTIYGAVSPWNVFQHFPQNGYLTNINKVQAYAITAGALLWRNTASYQNAQGNFGATQVGKGDGWETVAAQGSYSAIAAAYANQWVSRFAAKGEYGFLKPEDGEDLAMNSDSEIGTATWSTGAFPLEERAPFLVFAASVSDTAGRDTTIRIATHNQYATNDTWSDIRPPENNPKDWEAAMEALASMEQFYDNPTHIRDILATIGKYGRVAANIAGFLLDAFGSDKAKEYAERVRKIAPAFDELTALKKKKTAR